MSHAQLKATSRRWRNKISACLNVPSRMSKEYELPRQVLYLYFILFKDFPKALPPPPGSVEEISWKKNEMTTLCRGSS